jgi:outer membrane protein assembly factor BamA
MTVARTTATGNRRDSYGARRLLVAVALLCGLAGASGQQQAFPLQNLKVQGNHRFPPVKIIAASGLKIGAPVTKADFDAARARLLSTGAFESVGYEFKPSADNKGFDAVLDIVEVDQLYSYRFEDLPAGDDAIRAALRKQEPILGDQIPATEEVLERYTNEIQKLVGDRVKVAGKLNADIPGQMAIVFRPNTPRPQIAEVKFTGNQVLPATQLARSLADVAVGTGYTETTFRMLLDSSIRPLYEGRGRIRVSFPKISLAESTMVDGVIVTTTVEEGPAYSLGSLKFAGIAPKDADELQRIANIQSNDIANFDDVKAGVDRVLARFHSRGYLRATYRLDRAIDDKEHKVDVTAAIDAGPQFTMGKLEIIGLDLTSEPAIRKMWAIKTGAPFQPDYPDSFLNDIRAQDLFDNLGKTKADTNVEEKTHVVDVKLIFNGAGPEPKKRRPGRGASPDALLF